MNLNDVKLIFHGRFSMKDELKMNGTMVMEG